MNKEFWQNMYQVAFNIFLFIVIQCLFFYFISSSFVQNIIQDKIARITDIFFKQLEPVQKKMILADLEEEIKKIKPKAEQKKKENAEKNAKMMLLNPGSPLFIAPSFIAGFALLLFIVPFIFSSEQLFTFSWEFFLPLFYMLLAYSTEIGIFLILMNRYEYIGTFEILNKINKKLPSININDITY